MEREMQKRNVYVFAALLVTLVALGVAQTVFERAAAQNGAAVQAPRFEVDPMWPKPLPNGWLIGSTIGITVDAQDHVWIIHRPDTFTARTEIGTGTNPPTAELCCKAAPPVLEFDAAGNLVGQWGGPGQGYDWPTSNHGIWVDHKGNVWIGGNGQGDSHVLKFSRDGKFLAQYGKPNVRSVPVGAGEKPRYQANSSDQENFGRVAKIFVDPKSNEAYLADGYLNKRVAVIDGETGKMKRFWGAYGEKPDDTNMGLYNPDAPPIRQFRNPVHCADVSNDGLVYVCDRPNNRLQVFKTDGTFVKEEFYFKKTLGDGAVWDIAFSKDPQQKYIYLADGKNERVHILDRQSLQLLTSFGDGGRQPGQFFAVHSIATDSKGNLYTTETYEGKRVQKFVFKGVGAVTKKDQGVLWPGKPTSSR
jgi:DNA-binding beta-propeller fold protein YncE